MAYDPHKAFTYTLLTNSPGTGLLTHTCPNITGDMSARKFDNAATAKMVREYQDGAKVNDLASQYGLSKKTVYRAIHHHDIPLRGKIKPPFERCIIVEDGEQCTRTSQYRESGWCSTHYARWQKYGDPLYIQPQMQPLTIGDRYSKLTVTKLVSARGARDRQYLCTCECGREVIATASNLRRTDRPTNSCGFWPCSPQSKPYGVCARNRVLRRYKRSAGYRNHAWCLTDEEFVALTAGDCRYCGEPPLREESAVSGSFIYNGIDRVDNTQGYSRDNCVSCCWTCNWAKNQLSEEAWWAWIKRLVKHNGL